MCRISCGQTHSKNATEAAQLMCTTVWVDHVLGFVPRALNKEESKILNEHKAKIKDLLSRKDLVSISADDV